MASKFGGVPIESKFGGKALLSAPLSGMPEGSSLERAMNQKPVVDFGTFVMATPAFQFIEGAADLPLGAAQFVSESLGSDKVTNFLRKREERIQRGREAVDADALNTAARVAGNVGTALAATAGIPVSASFTGKVAQGAGIGAVAGAATPATSDDIEQEKQGQIATGAALGGLVPAGLEIGKGIIRTGRNLIRPFLPKGVDATVRQAVGETTDDIPRTVQALRSAKPGETAGQATAKTGNTRLAAFEQAGAKAQPDDFARIQSQQNASRLQRLRAAGGASEGQTLDDAIEAARVARQRATNPLYESAKRSGSQVNLDRTKTLVNRIIESDPKNKKIVSALNDVRDSIDDTTSPREAISAWRNIQNLIDEKGPTGQKVNESIVRQLATVRRSLESEIGRSVPEFRKANQLYKELSKPFDRARVAKVLEDKLTSTLSGSDESVLAQKAASFSGALDDERKLIAQATGFKRGSGLDKFFDEDEITVLGNISNELKNNAEFNRLAQMGRPGAKSILGTLGPEPVANPLNRVIMIVNALIRKAGTVKQEETIKRIGEIFQNPNQLADLLEGSTPREISLIKSALSKVPVDQLARTAPAVTVNQ